MNKLADISAFESLSISHTTTPVTAFNQRKAVNNHRVFNGFVRKAAPWIIGAGALAGLGKHVANHPEDYVRADTFLNTPISEHVDELKYKLQKVNPFDNRDTDRVLYDNLQAKKRSLLRDARRKALLNRYAMDYLLEIQADESNKKAAEKLAKLLNYARAKNIEISPQLKTSLKSMNIDI